MDKRQLLQRISADPCHCLVNFDPAAVENADENAIPLVADDNFIVRDTVCAAGSKMLYNFRPPFQAEAVDRALAAGYALIGRANIGEFNMAGTETSWFGPTLHPRDAARCSSGAAAAVAQGLADAALIVDAGGENLRQAALAGCAAFRPTYGSVSRHGIIAYLSSTEQAAGLARTLDAAAALVQAVAGHDGKDATSLPAAGYDFRAAEGADGLRVALLENDLDACGPAAAAAVAAAEARLLAAGATVTRVRLHKLALARQALLVMAAAEGCNNISRFDGVKYGYRAAQYRNIEDLYCNSRSEAFGDTAKYIAMLGTFVLSQGSYEQYYRKALQLRYQIKQELNALFAAYDAALAPLSDHAAERLDALAWPAALDPSRRYGAAPALAGLPVAAVPLGAEDGLPLGVQLFADSGQDTLALRAAKAVEGGDRQ